MLFSVLLALACAAIAALGTWIYVRLRAEVERSGLIRDLTASGERLAVAEHELASLRAQHSSLSQEFRSETERRADLQARLEEERKSAAEKLAFLQDTQAQLSQAFRALSAEALQSNNRSFLQLAEAALAKQQETAKGELTAREQAIGELVKPLREALTQVDNKVQSLEVTRASAYSALAEQLKSLGETQKHLHTETSNLVRALRAPATRGRWGEMQLKRAVELAGMTEHCDYSEQHTVDSGEGKLRPDLIVYMAGHRRVVVDAKVPLLSYLDALECTDDAVRLGHFRAHAAQVRTHVSKLSAKSYWSQFEPAPDFVVAFLPGESFFSAALEHDPTLIDFGVDQRVLLATPTTLIALLKSIAFGWRQEKLAQNAEEISLLGRELYSRLARLLVHFAKVGSHLDRATRSYNETVATLESRVLVTARKMREKGGAAGEELQTLPLVEHSARSLNVPELLLPPESARRN